MAYILPILHYTGISGFRPEYISHEMNVFKDYNGVECRELLIRCRHNLNIPVSFKTRQDQALISVRSDGTALFRLPVLSGALKLYYDNYRDYYYLPYEDCCIYRSAASGVDPSGRVNATKETCYTRHTGLFFPQLSSCEGPLFRKDYDSKERYILYSRETGDDIIRRQAEAFRLR